MADFVPEILLTLLILVTSLPEYESDSICVIYYQKQSDDNNKKF